MIDLVWLALIAIIAIAQLSQAKNKTQLRGKPFEPQRRSAPQVAPAAQPVRKADRILRKEEPSWKARDLQIADPALEPGDRASTRQSVQQPSYDSPAREPYPMPDLRSAVVWSEIIAPPVSKRRGRR